MRNLKDIILERLVINKHAHNVDIEVFDVFNNDRTESLVCGDILLNGEVKALFYFFNNRSRSALSQFYVYTDERTYDELYDEDYTNQMHDAGQFGAYPNKYFRNNLNNALSNNGFKEIQNNLIFLRYYEEIDSDWGLLAPHCSSTESKERWIKWIEHFNTISGEELTTDINRWMFSQL